MRIPIFEEIVIKNFDPLHVAKKIKSSKIGRIPCYISLHSLKRSEAEQFADNMAQTLKTLGIHPLFPYPLYLVSNKLASHPEIPIVGKVSDLPRYYFRKVKRLNRKELALLNKVHLLSEKISNIDLYQRFTELEKTQIHQKDIYDLCKEISFYEAIVEDLDQLEGQNES